MDPDTGGSKDQEGIKKNEGPTSYAGLVKVWASYSWIPTGYGSPG